MQGIDLGQIVHSRSGRDKNKYFIVVGIIDDDYILLADGDLRKIGTPKKKKIKHVVLHDMIAENIKQSLEDGNRINDADLRKNLKSMGLL